MDRPINKYLSIQLTKEQNDLLDTLIDTAIKADVNHEIDAICISEYDLDNGVLHDFINPHILINTKNPSHELYESVVRKDFPIISEFNTPGESIPATMVTLWKRE